MKKAAQSTTALLFIALSVWALREASLMPAGTEGTPGPSFFPRLIGIFLGALGAALLLQTILSRKRPDEGGGEKTAAPFSPVLFLLLAIAYVMAMNPLGFLPSTTLFLFVSTQWMRGEKPIGNLAFSAAGAIGVYLFFGALLKVPLQPLPFGY
ncbi:MAG: tripartite tricarboxylate transporter TctB family protein [bacterium]